MSRKEASKTCHCRTGKSRLDSVIIESGTDEIDGILKPAADGYMNVCFVQHLRFTG